MSLIENYCNAVVRFLNNKDEIKAEVREMIYSMLEEKYGYQENYREEDIISVLKEIGNPNILAIKYTNLPKQIVSNKYTYQLYYTYLIVLFIVSVIHFFGFIFDVINEPTKIYIKILEFLQGFITNAFMFFGIVVVVFMFLEYYHKDVDIGKKFNPIELKKVKTKDVKPNIYKKSDSIISIIFTLAFLVILNFFPMIFKVYVNEEWFTIINLDYLQSIIWYFNIIFFITILYNIYLIYNQEKTFLKAFNIFMYGIIISIIFAILLINQEFLNPRFLEFLIGIDFFENIFGNVVMMQKRIMQIFIGLGVIGHTIHFIVTVIQILIYKRRRI